MNNIKLSHEVIRQLTDIPTQIDVNSMKENNMNSNALVREDPKGT